MDRSLVAADVSTIDILGKWCGTFGICSLAATGEREVFLIVGGFDVD